ncbi:MAG: NAD-dependent epimerase/dehydratase family protein [Candidatus Levybacteria bacterium]|nr:NAD-dependent epimerase/dehydratase family protein [Candidatus Levybacteria bacterium]
MQNQKYNADFWKNKKILVTGGRGFVGSHVVKNLIEKRGVLKESIVIPKSKSCDLRIYNDTQEVLKGINIVLHLAADVGGIAYSSSHPATQMRNCLLIDANVFEAASNEKVERMVCVSSAVAYPVDAPSPLKEEYLFLGEPARGGYGYGFAKRMSTVLARAYKEEKGLNASVLLSSNAYGPGDNFDLSHGHVIPSLIRKCLSEKELVVWGDGTQKRDFFYVGDFAEGVVLAAEKLGTADPVNIGSADPITIAELVKSIVRLTNFKGKIIFDSTKPQGQKIRSVSIEKAKSLMGFFPSFTLEEGIKRTIDWYLKHDGKRDSKKS